MTRITWPLTPSLFLLTASVYDSVADTVSFTATLTVAPSANERCRSCWLTPSIVVSAPSIRSASTEIHRDSLRLRVMCASSCQRGASLLRLPWGGSLLSLYQVTEGCSSNDVSAGSRKE